MGKVESNKKQKKDALFNTAFELFTTKGTNKTTISDIADKACVAKGTFYLYFKDKYDIRNKLVSYKTKELFYRAYQSVLEHEISGFDNQLHFMVDFIFICFIILIDKHINYVNLYGRRKTICNFNKISIYCIYKAYISVRPDVDSYKTDRRSRIWRTSTGSAR